MNPLVKKEIRLLLPNAAICCALGLTNFCFQFGPNGELQNWFSFMLAFVFCGTMAVMLALNSFGAEISSGTFSNLLAQPVSRQKIWDTKIAVLALSLLAVGVFWSACGVIRLSMIGQNLGLLDLLTVVGMFGLVVFSGALWTVLLLRQIAAAFWFTLLVPGVLLVIMAGLLAAHSDDFNAGMIASVLGVYSLGGFFFARWLFFRAQDWQWTGGTLVMPEMRGLARFKSLLGARRPLTPRVALWRKEIQLHQSQFVIAFVLLLLHLAAIVTRKLGHFRPNSATEFVLESFWMLWLVMPLLVGCTAVAEERKLGTHESQLCLPVMRRTQFTVKLLAAFGLSLFFGVLMPLLLEGKKVLPDVHFKFNGLTAVEGVVGLPGFHIQMSTMQIFFWDCFRTLDVFLPLLTLVGIVVLTVGIAVYVSTLMRNTLQTLAPAVAGIVLAWFLIIIAPIPTPFEYQLGFLWRGPLPYFIVLPAMALTLLALAGKNFQHVVTGWKQGGRNLLALAIACALAVAFTSAIYHRAWEKLTPFEPPHSPARLTLANPATLNTDGGSASVRLPDGRVWAANILFDRTQTPLASMLGNSKMFISDAQFAAGSNWLTVKRTLDDLVGIKTDGTLWVSERPRQIVRGRNRWKINDDAMRQLVQFGADRNWTSVMPRVYSVLLTKADGTLWRWGATNYNYGVRTNRWPGLRAFTPERLGAESDWAEIFRGNYRTYFRKTDGSLWTDSYSGENNGLPTLELEPGYYVAEIYDGRARGAYRSTATIGWNYRVGVRDDGTFRLIAHQVPVFSAKQRYVNSVWSNLDLQIGDGTRWLAVAGDDQKIVTLKNDGTLWLWNFHRPYYNWVAGRDSYKQGILKTAPVQLGAQADWMAISSWGDIVLALSADGGLWYWPLAESAGSIYLDNNHSLPQLLDYSHKPRLLGNVFGKSG